METIVSALWPAGVTTALVLIILDAALLAWGAAIPRLACYTIGVAILLAGGALWAAALPADTPPLHVIGGQCVITAAGGVGTCIAEGWHYGRVWWDQNKIRLADKESK